MSSKNHQDASGRRADEHQKGDQPRNPPAREIDPLVRKRRDGRQSDGLQGPNPQESNHSDQEHAADAQAGEGPPTPAQLGLAMPAEWHPHQATWLAYPSNETTFPELGQVRRTFHEMIASLLPHEEVHLLIDGERVEEVVRSQLPSDVHEKRLVCHVLPTSDAWIRDYGPNFLLRRPDGETEGGAKRIRTTEGEQGSKRQVGKKAFERQGGSAVRNAETAFNDWIFNAWGGKYPDLLPDDGVPRKLESFLSMPRFTPGIVLEGGSIEVDGADTCLTTEQCLLHPNRNPDLDRPGVERCLKDYLGVSRILWLGDGIVGDDTDGHIDDIARFTSPDTIVCALEEDPADENYGLLQENLERLQSFRRSNGQPYRIVTLPMPQPLFEEDGTRLPASYANFYIANGVVLVPTFNDPRDTQALETLQGLFPGRRVQGVDCRQLVRGLGALHCVTQQQPSGH